MSKILILEDRPSRQRLFLPNREKDIETLLSISGLSIPLVDDCKKIIDEINNERYLFKDTLKLLIIHKSSINSKGLMYVYKACKDQCIKIIFFSGGIAQKVNFSDGDYKYREDAKTFQKEFYYVNFLDKIGEFESKFSENYRGKNHARNKAKWYANNKWALIKIQI